MAEAAAAAAPAPPVEPPAQPMSTEDAEAIENAKLRQAVAASERAYAEASLTDEAAMLRFLLGKLEG